MFRFLDHPSETLIEVKAATVAKVFEDAACALFEIMTDASKIRCEKEFEIELEGSDRSLLLIDWLNKLIVVHEVEKVFLSNFDVQIEPSWKLRAVVGGEPIKGAHERRSHAKSATYGQLEWVEDSSGHCVRFVIDV